MKNYFSLIKFSHTVFALPFAIIGFLLGLKDSGRGFEIMALLKMLLCMVFARSAAMAFNRYIDRDIDIENPRTRLREIPAGIIAPQSALYFTAINAILFIGTTFFINPLCFYLSPIALLVVLGYSYTKRFTALCHFVLGLGLSLAPLGAYLSVTGSFAYIPLLFALAVLFWVSGFDIIYALQDEDFDLAQNLYSVPAWIGKRKALNLSSLIHVFSVLFILIAGIMLAVGIFYWIGFSIFVSLLIYQHLIVRPDDLKRVNLAFFTTNGLASIIFSAFFIADYFFGRN